MRKKMIEAAMHDNEARKAGQVATQKLKLLPEVVAVFNRHQMRNAAFDPDSGLIEAVKFFLEPLSDGSLPAYDVQRELFNVLASNPMPKETLIQSGIGKVTLFYTKSKRAQPGIKRTAERLVRDWSRPILKRSDDYRERVLEQADYDPRYEGVSTPSKFLPPPRLFLLLPSFSNVALSLL